MTESDVMVMADTAVDTFGALEERTRDLDRLYRSILQRGTDYDNVPGTNKPTLLKSGAELLRLWMKLVPDFQITGGEQDDGHYSYEVMCKMYFDPERTKLAGVGVGLCTTRESKYAFRWAWPNEVPPDVDKSALKTKKFSKGDKTYTQYRVDNENPADQANTALKMAKKRAFVDAILTITGASRIFTQDVEDMVSHTEPQPTSQAEPPKRRGRPPKTNPNGVPEDTNTPPGEGLISRERWEQAKAAVADIPDIELCSMIYDATGNDVKPPDPETEQYITHRGKLEGAISGMSNKQCTALSQAIGEWRRGQS